MLFIYAFTFSMERSTIFLGQVSNESNRVYAVDIYGQAHSVILNTHQSVNLNKPIVELVGNQQFPVKAEVVLKEKMPLGYPSEEQPVQILQIKAFEYCLIAIKGFFEKKYILQPNKQYIIHLTIDREDYLDHELFACS
ncbi:MAG TPA: hypothetical protein VL201_01065 [Patescibacteria group bacterium]|nr:hypothetical protein [Patescibacteria group bacterium]